LTIALAAVRNRIAKLERGTTPPETTPRPPRPNVRIINKCLVVDGIVLAEVAARLRQQKANPSPTTAAVANDPEGIEACRRLKALVKEFQRWPDFPRDNDPSSNS
jgi:hypothetical protein